MKVFSLRTCDTCRKAVKALKEAHGDIEIVDIRKDGMSTEAIAHVVDAVGWEKALNRNSLTWRQLDDPQKHELDNVKAVSLIAAHPTLMKRPAITDGTTVTVGWKDDAKAAWL